MLIDHTWIIHLHQFLYIVANKISCQQQEKKGHIMMYEHETLQDELDRRDGIPDYYDTMYLDGYDVNQICRAFDKVQRKKFRKIWQEKQAKREQQELEHSIKADLEKTVEKALDELLAGFNK